MGTRRKSRSPSNARHTSNVFRTNGTTTKNSNTMAEMEGHRVKRIKTDDAVKGRATGRPAVSGHTPNGARTRNDVVMDPGIASARANERVDVAALAAHVAASVVADINPTNSAKLTLANTNSVSSAKVTMGDPMEIDAGGQARSKNPQIDLASAPADPTELAIWVAQQISHFQDEGRDPTEVDDEQLRLRLLSHPPGIYGRRLDEDSNPAKVAEREKLREENRERKKRWRLSNTERNKDNDLRCRINKRAKSIYGMGPSPEKSAWMESEFNKRRTKRESKERQRGFGNSEFPGFPIATDLGSTLFSAADNDSQHETNAAGILLSNVLLGPGRNGRSNTEAAAALKSALADDSVDPRPFIEALRTMATSQDVMNGINEVLRYEGDDDEADTLSGDENADLVVQPTELRSGAAAEHAPQTNDQETDIIKALNAATAILNEMTETKSQTYTTPYGNPPPQSEINGFTAVNGVNGVNGANAQKSNGIAKLSSSRPVVNDHGLDQSQIDALLALANGGSLTDDDDDNTIADGLESVGQQPDQTSTPQPDSDITATLQLIVSQLMAERNGDNGHIQRGLAVSTSQADRYGLNSAKDQAATLQSLFHQAGVSINTIIPAAQSLATSQLYARLSNRARSSTPMGGGINPAHASAYGNTAQMNQRMLARPGVFGNPLQQATSSSRGNVVGPPLRARSAEEMKKVKSYGYPPLPGSRPGVRKK